MAREDVIIPNPRIAVPMMGIMKWTLAYADHPYQNSPTGMINEPNIRAGTRISGLSFPPFFAARYKYILLQILAPNIVVDSNPTPSPIYDKPPIPTLKWYTFEKRSGKVVNIM